MCSSRWETPACSSDSAAEPVAIQKPSATERTLGTRSVTTLTPESSAVIRCSVFTGAGGSIALAPMARGTGASLPVTARPRLAGGGALGARAPVAGGPPPAAVAAGADAGEFLDRLARDVGVVG